MQRKKNSLRQKCATFWGGFLTYCGQKKKKSNIVVCALKKLRKNISESLKNIYKDLFIKIQTRTVLKLLLPWFDFL